MSLWRKREPLHVRLAREGGIPLDDDEAGAIGPAWDEVGIHGVHRPREWDAVVTVEAPEIDADRVAFVVLEGREVVVESGPDNLQPLANACAAILAPPFRAEAVRRDRGLWAVAGRTVTLIELPGVEGSEIELASHRGSRTLLVDGVPAFGTIPLLEREDHVVRAHRLRGNTWDVSFDPL
jgi:hypothetical protein